MIQNVRKKNVTKIYSVTIKRERQTDRETERQREREREREGENIEKEYSSKFMMFGKYK